MRRHLCTKPELHIHVAKEKNATFLNEGMLSHCVPPSCRPHFHYSAKLVSFKSSKTCLCCAYLH
ncbi:hypothetical protein T03_14315 [Trichinella britovi]|uniref:Uncharacterized protein n=1 Tax=Trichinella britovi TaxID=45882 RepID=A0A0V1C0J2_TRIBR|nr:hypothetical protein T03_2862 [Trichinella britovi]KRY59381.1 hypothetical protein T03_14315 [Trichinella britovi]